MNDSLSRKLEKLGYKDLTLDSLPREVFIPTSEKNIKRQPVVYMVKVEKRKYSIFLFLHPDDDESVLNTTTAARLDEAIGKMILFLENSNLLNPMSGKEE